MAIQMIFCVETSKSADTDSIYILDTINRWYKVDNKLKISKINMNTKSRYNSKDVVREIAQKNERSFERKDYNKVKVLIDFIEQHGEITPKEAENITKKFAATVRRYLKMLVDTERIVTEGNTNNSKYHVSPDMSDSI